MKKSIATLALALAGVSLATAQTKLTQDFEGVTLPALPATWTEVVTATTGWKTNSGKVVSQSPWACPEHTQYAFIDDWNNDEKNNPSILQSPVFDLTGVTTPYLSYDYYFVGGYYSSTKKQETCIVQITTNGGANWTTIDTLKGNSAAWQTHYVNLSTYAGAAAVQIAFRYADDSTKMPGCGLDNIKVYQPPTADAAITGITPTIGSPTDYAVVNTPITLGGTFFNKGTATVTSFIVKYQQGANPAVSNSVTGVNIAPFTSYDFTCSNPFTMPGTLGDYPIKMWIELPGDADNTNDSSNTGVTAVLFKPAKKILVEEGTGTWCGWCPRGAVYMDSLHNNYDNNFSLVAVHNKDLMVVPAYDAFIGGKIGGYPSVLVDRRQELDPSDLIDIYNEQKDYFGFADITLKDLNAGSFDFSVKVSVKPALELSGDYRLALALTESKVVGRTDGGQWDQHNYYSFETLNIPLVGAGHNWQAEKDPIPGTKMHYDFVARMIIPDPNGAAGSLPATMTANTTYDYTFTTTIPQPYFRKDMKAVVMLIRNSDGAVLNTANMQVPVGISNVDAGIQRMNVYPNPASDMANITFNLTERAAISVQVIDAVGRVVSTVNEQQYEKGAQRISVSTAGLSNGLYTIKLQSEKGNLTQQLSVVK